MSGAHGHARIEEVAARRTPVHRLDARAKIVALIGLAVVSATTPVGRWNAFAGYLLLLALLAAVARLPPGYLLRRMTVEVPFLAAAAVLVFTAPEGPAVGVTVAAKATVGVLAMVVLSSTTPFPVLLAGFDALRAPRTITMTVGLLWRYLQVFGDELRRMRLAQRARGHRPRWLWQTGAIGATIGTMFVRTYERGERVHQAMLARGYRGAIPATLQARQRLRTADVAFCAALAAVVVPLRVLA